MARAVRVAGPPAASVSQRRRLAARDRRGRSAAPAAGPGDRAAAEARGGVAVGVARTRAEGSRALSARRRRPGQRRLLRPVLGSRPEAQARWTQSAPGCGSLWTRHGDRAEALPPGGVRRLWLHRPVRDGGGGPGAGGRGAELPPALGRGGPLQGEAAASAGEGGPEAG